MGALADLRGDVADALRIAVKGHSEWSVYPLPIESPQPPCYLLLWSEPWLEPKTHCSFTARLDVRIVGPRIEPDTGLEILEAMIEAAAVELDRAGHPVRSVSQPRPYIINTTRYQSAVLALVHTVNVTHGGPS